MRDFSAKTVKDKTSLSSINMSIFLFNADSRLFIFLKSTSIVIFLVLFYFPSYLMVIVHSGFRFELKIIGTVRARQEVVKITIMWQNWFK